MKQIATITALLTVISAGIAHLYGRALHLANPNGILLHTPAPGELAPTEPAYPLGFLVGGVGVALCVFFCAASFFMAARFFWPNKREVAWQFFVASMLSGVLVVLIGWLVGILA